MRKFREFFYSNENKAFLKNEMYYRGHFQFPDMHDKYDPTKVPVGGFKSLSQLQQFQKETTPEKKQLEERKDLLDKLAALAENAFSAYEARKNNPMNAATSERYMQGIEYDEKTGVLSKLPQKDIIGRYPSIKFVQLTMAMSPSINVIKRNPDPTGSYYDLDTKKLKQLMEEAKKQSVELERKFEKQSQLTGGVDNVARNVVSTALSNSNVPNFASMPYQS